MFHYVEVFLLLIFTVLCGILLALWRIHEKLERLGAGKLTAAASPTHSSTSTATSAAAAPPLE